MKYCYVCANDSVSQCEGCEGWFCAKHGHKGDICVACQSTTVTSPASTEDFCDSCGHSEYDHVTEEDNAYCLGGLAGQKGCRCSEFRPKARGIVCVMITPGEEEAPASGQKDYEEWA